MQKAVILDIPFDAMPPEELLQMLHRFLKSDKNHLVITPNPEVVMRAQRDEKFKQVLLEAALLLPDGIGIILASKFTQTPIHNRLTGCDTAFALLDSIKNTPYTVYFLGAAPGVAQNAKVRMEEKYPGLSVIGTHDGYFDEKEEKIIINEINEKKPDVLIIGMSAPRQEFWAHTNRDKLPVKVTLCLGGTIDIMGGNVKRAPAVMRKLGLEWFYRLVTQPQRAKRMLDLPRFMLAALAEAVRKSRQ